MNLFKSFFVAALLLLLSSRAAFADGPILPDRTVVVEHVCNIDSHLDGSVTFETCNRQPLVISNVADYQTAHPQPQQNTMFRYIFDKNMYRWKLSLVSYDGKKLPNVMGFNSRQDCEKTAKFVLEAEVKLTATCIETKEEKRQ